MIIIFFVSRLAVMLPGIEVRDHSPIIIFYLSLVHLFLWPVLILLDHTVAGLYVHLSVNHVHPDKMK